MLPCPICRPLSTTADITTSDRDPSACRPPALDLQSTDTAAAAPAPRLGRPGDTRRTCGHRGRTTSTATTLPRLLCRGAWSEFCLIAIWRSAAQERRGAEHRPSDGKIKGARCAAVGRQNSIDRSDTWRSVRESMTACRFAQLIEQSRLCAPRVFRLGHSRHRAITVWRAAAGPPQPPSRLALCTTDACGSRNAIRATGGPFQRSKPCHLERGTATERLASSIPGLHPGRERCARVGPHPGNSGLLVHFRRALSGITKQPCKSDKPPWGETAPGFRIRHCPTVPAPSAGGTAGQPLGRSSVPNPNTWNVERPAGWAIGAISARICANAAVQSTLQAMRFVHRLPLFARTLP
jgi:hypothetical protein